MKIELTVEQEILNLFMEGGISATPFPYKSIAVL